MSLRSGTKLGPYEIVAPIGAGGMGEVYRARDTKLGREAAIKLLSDAVSSNSESRARFEREARTLASVNHPGIVTIFAIEQASGHDFIAMELVEGRPLSELIVRGGIKLDRLLNIAAQISAAVAVAHKHGIVHRDLKPANVIVGAHDRVKVLDFGIAKLRASAANDGQTMPPTKEITGEGKIVGTVAYMSPEQAEGQAVDDRSDVFSLGVLLYEMATGERPFKGDTSISVLSSILKDTPKPVTEIAPAVPKELARIVRRCLSKDPDDRYQSAADLRSDIEDLRQSAISGELNVAPSSAATPRLRMPVAAVAGVLVVVLAAGWAMTRSAPAETAPTIPTMTFSRLTLLEGVASDSMVSPDGKWVVYVSNVSGNQDVYLQSASGQTPINLTKDSQANETQPSFSPDGELIAFRSERDGGGLFVMGRTGESVRRLTKNGYQPSWFPDGKTIAFVSVPAVEAEARGGDISQLWTVSAAGGEPKRLTNGDAVQPRVSPTGKRIAFWSLPTDESRTRFTEANRDVWTVAADGSDPVQVTNDAATDWNPVWSPDGHWLYFLSNRSGSMNLWRVAIDEKTGHTRGAPQALTAPASYVRHFSLSSDGSLAAYATQDFNNNVGRIAFDPATGTTRGEYQPLTNGPRDFQQVDVSPDGTQLVLSTNSRSQEDLFIISADGGGLRSLTNDRARDRSPRWQQDGKSILFYSDRRGGYETWRIDRDGGGLQQLTDTGGRRFFPIPNVNGSKVAVPDIGAWELFTYDARNWTKPAEKLAPVPPELRSSGATLTPQAFSPDGSLLLGTTQNVGSWIYSFESRTYRDMKLRGAGGGRWLPDGRRFLITRQNRVQLADAQTGAVRDVFGIKDENIGNMTVSPDGRWIYFTHGLTTGDIWVVRFDDTATAETPVK